MAAAIELYNKPGIPYRNESFAILAVNGWELLLKARWVTLHQNKINSLYVHERKQTAKGRRSRRETIKKTDSGAPITQGMLHIAGQLHASGHIEEAVYKNLEGMSEIRDCATHFYAQSTRFNARIYEFAAACVKNFSNAVREWFGRDVVEFGVHIMPLTFVELPPNVEAAILNAEEKRVLAFLEGVDNAEADPNTSYSISVNVDINFTKSKSRDGVQVQVTQDPNAMEVTLTEEDIRKRYPWDFRTLSMKCRERYVDFKENQDYHRIRKSLEGDARFGHLRLLDPNNPSSSQKMFFDPNIMAKFDEHYTKRPPSA